MQSTESFTDKLSVHDIAICLEIELRYPPLIAYNKVLKLRVIEYGEDGHTLHRLRRYSNCTSALLLSDASAPSGRSIRKSSPKSSVRRLPQRKRESIQLPSAPKRLRKLGITRTKLPFYKGPQKSKVAAYLKEIKDVPEGKPYMSMKPAPKHKYSGNMPAFLMGNGPIRASPENVMRVSTLSQSGGKAS